ncbi:ubiquitin C-terminal hydrolase Ubp14 [Coemansia asiatica]|uniref:Ubiquitin carboxyl-terminal hydrolase n=1 Tax=Coemansia asiatica TaxID=1052880 RepID=A0A9W7XIA7_9FUNG|nr:ubiquitin C-terminal hydrolase Ubp14 [Coemansia asiatica]KAJ2877345.1 ubiquitin C-terminal hydrolase Ubp14 [Coemansia asiatica]
MAMICEHALNSRLTPPSSSTPVYKEECTQCFDNHDMDGGIEVCLSCFNGGCSEGPHQHAQQHSMKTGHYLTLNIRRIAKTQSSDDERPAKQTKLEIREESDENKYEYQTFVRCWGCSGAKVEDGLENIEPTVQAVIHAVEASKGSEIKAWSEEVTACAHFESLEQSLADGFGLEKMHQCSSCDKHDNLWMCLVCGHVGCGRRQYDGTGGNNHAIEHFEKTGHKVSIKLGTITPEGTADAYCYACDDNKMDPNLARHLTAFGINVSAQQKTEKSIAELQLEQNLKFDFSMTTADGVKLQPVAGPGLTGLRNLGNSCYMGSVLQCVFGIDRFRDRYFPSAAEHFAMCTNSRPAQCVLCQLHKLADGLWSGRYAVLDTGSEGEMGHQRGIPPAQFKSAIAKDHYEFSTMRQQDAFEFFQHLNKQVNIIERSVASGSRDPTKVFDYSTEERIQCTQCKKVRCKIQRAISASLPVIKRFVEQPGSQGEDDDADAQKQHFAPVSFKECLDLMTRDETVEGYNCPECKVATLAVKSTRFATFPKVLAVQVRRFELVNWVPQKLDIPIVVPLEPVDLGPYQGHGIRPGEEKLPETEEAEQDNSNTQSQPVEEAIDETVVEQLESMGFPRVRCVKAVRKTGNCGAEVAMNWIFEHMDDPDIDVADEPSTQSAAASHSSPSVDPEAVEQLMAMGFDRRRIEKELINAGGDPNRALDRLLSFDGESGDVGNDANDANDVTMASPAKASDDSETASKFELTGFVSHKGSSVHCGHYIANIRQGLGSDTQWFLFNDSKVVLQTNPDPEQAYIYFFTRSD